MKQRLVQWTDEIRTYAREARRPQDFARVVRVRLSQSKIGRLVCPWPIVVDVDLASLGRDVRLRSHTTDISVLGELLVSGAYAAVPQAGENRVAVVVDLGANIGLTARWMASRWPGARVLCVEPEPGNAAVLRHNVRTLSPGTQVIQACVGGAERRVGLATSAGQHGYAMTTLGDDATEVEVLTMNHVLSVAGIDKIDVLKCDIEGAEEELFAECRPWIGQVAVAVVECHGTFGIDDLLEVLAANDADFEVVERTENAAYGCETVTLRRRD